MGQRLATLPGGLLQGWGRPGRGRVSQVALVPICSWPWRTLGRNSGCGPVTGTPHPGPCPVASWKQGEKGCSKVEGRRRDAEHRDRSEMPQVQGAEVGSEASRSRRATSRKRPGGRASQAGCRPEDLGCALRAASSDSFFSRFFSSSGNFS